VTFTAPTEPGSYPFFCAVHPEAMQGVLTVVEGAAAPPEDEGGGGGGEAAQPLQEAPTAVEVSMADFSFDAPEASVAPGGEVTWTNDGDAPHTATFDEVELDTGQLASGEQGALTAPTEPGSYTYFCAVHPGQMRGVLVVVPPGTADPTAPDAPAAAIGGDPAAQPAAEEGESRGLTLVILLAAVIGAFLGGLGLSMLIRNRRRPGPPPPPSPTGQPM
jgi:plastocyanin